MSMVIVDIDGIEDLVCYDRKLRKLLPSLNGLFRQWELCMTLQGMDAVRKRTLADILNALPDHVDILCEYFAEDIRVEELDYSIVRNLEIDLDKTEGSGGVTHGMLGFAISRDADRLYLSSWR